MAGPEELSVTVVERDLSPAICNMLRREPEIACDLETSGLDWVRDEIGTYQIFLPNARMVLVLRVARDQPPHRLIDVLGTAQRKIFHHAMFDCRFITHKWRIGLHNIACTKVLAKILNPKEPSGLADLLVRYAGIELDKSLQRADWTDSAPLNEAQIAYAVKDVIYLPTLFRILSGIAAERKLTPLTDAALQFLPVQVQLDLLGCENVFRH